ncbi:GspH/FimT family pseudopilin [Robiginitomaculum antarcticum]|uniref:GspH/FimT family pseudopilin n=1 Tax=Robiginitomaculum antarcticum TaxID=437507 RepID=UPI00039C93DB|nr:GspH/FimT family pseudopilin [Robiginitomaculum antarcticum]
MPMSPAGKNKIIDRQAGFTLVEVLTVLTIIALVTGAVVLTLPPKTPEALEQARDLRTDLNVAADDALLRGQPTALSVTQTGYQIYSYDALEWQSLKDAPWADGVSAQLRRDGEVMTLPDTPTPLIIFEPVGQSESFELRLQSLSGTYVLRNSGNGRTVLGDDRP